MPKIKTLKRLWILNGFSKFWMIIQCINSNPQKRAHKYIHQYTCPGIWKLRATSIKSKKKHYRDNISIIKEKKEDWTPDISKENPNQRNSTRPRKAKLEAIPEKKRKPQKEIMSSIYLRQNIAFPTALPALQRTSASLSLKDAPPP